MEWSILHRKEHPSPRSSHVAGLLLDKKKNLELVVLFGGIAGSLRDDNWALNCSLGTWRPLTIQIPPTVSSAYVCTDYNIFIFGGMKKDGQFVFTNRLLEYNHVNETMAIIDPIDSKFIPPPLISAAMVHHKGILYIFGGLDVRSNVSNRLFMFNLQEKIWSLNYAKNSPPGRFGHSINIWYKKVEDKTEVFLIIYGGCLGKEKNMQNAGDILIYSIDYNKWYYPPMQGFPENYTGRVKHTAFLHGSKLVVFGGLKSSILSPSLGWEACNDVIYIKIGINFCTLEKEEFPNIIPRAAHTLASRKRSSQALIFGGYTNAQGYLSDLNEIVVLDFFIPNSLTIRLEKGYIRWDDPFNMHGRNTYELIIIDSQNRERNVAYHGHNNYWFISGLKLLNHYTAYLLVSNALGSSENNPELDFVYQEYILPPQNVQVKLEGVNVHLKWEASQSEKSYLLFYRICGGASTSSSRYARQATYSTPWMETSVGSNCKVETPVTFFIGESSSSEIAKEIEFQVVATCASARSEPSSSVLLNLNDFWINSVPVTSETVAIVKEEVMVEGTSDPIGENMITGEDDFEEIAEGETIRPSMSYEKKVKAPVLERKSSKIKINRDFGLDQNDNNSSKSNSLLKKKDLKSGSGSLKRKSETEIVESRLKQLSNADDSSKSEESSVTGIRHKDILEKKDKISSEKKEKIPLEIKEQIASEKIEKISTEIKDKISSVMKDKINPETKEKINTDKKEKISTEIKLKISTVKRDKMINPEIKITTEKKEKISTEKNDRSVSGVKDKIYTDKKEKNSPGINEKISIEKKDKILSVIDDKISTDKKDSKLSGIKGKISTEKSNTSVTNKEVTIAHKSKSLSLKSPIIESSIKKEAQEISQEYDQLFALFSKDSPKATDTIPQVYPVSQRLQLRIIEQQNGDADLKNNSVPKNPKGEHANLKDIPAVKSVGQIRALLFDPSKPMYYSLKYGTEIQVLYDNDWWSAKAIFYAYDKEYNLYLKVHFPGWKKNDDLYVPLKDGDRVIRDTSIPVLKKLPVYIATQFRFDITSKKPQHHYGLKAAEKDEVAERGYLLREIEPRSRFLDDNDDSSDQDYKLADE